jgi:uncharacterized membrane protein YhaH (DUF805 family)
MNIRPHELACALLGVAGIWFIAGAITGTAFFVAAAFETSPAPQWPGRRAFLVVSICGVLLNAAVGVALFFGREAIAARFFRDGTADGIASGPIQAAAFAVIGVAYFGDGLATVVERLEYLGTSASGNALLLGAIAKTAFGAVLFLGANGLAQYWHRRCAGPGTRTPNTQVQTERSSRGGL